MTVAYFQHNLAWSPDPSIEHPMITTISGSTSLLWFLARRRQPVSTVCTALLQVRLLVEEGQADVACRDRWGKTALEEAQRVGATSVVAYLQQRDGRLQRKSQSK